MAAAAAASVSVARGASHATVSPLATRRHPAESAGCASAGEPAAIRSATASPRGRVGRPPAPDSHRIFDAMRTLLIGAGFGTLLALGAALTTPSAARPEGSAAPGAVTSDTLSFQVRAGQPLLAALPGRHQGQPASYRVLEAPALSWLVDRAFYWRTLPSESGTMPILIRRVAPGVEPDTLVLMVRVLPANG